MEPQNGRVSFDIDPSATGLVLREALASGASQRLFLLNSVGGIDSCIGDRLVFVHNIHILVLHDFFKEQIQNLQ